MLQRGVMRHPKIAALSDAAFRLWVAGNDYCDEQLTNGVILKSALAARTVAARCTPKLIEELTRVLPPYQHPLWEDQGDHYQVHDYLDWNDSREVVQANRAKVRRRVTAFRLRRAQDPVSNADGNGGCNAVTNAGIDPIDRSEHRTSNIVEVPPIAPQGGRVTKRDLQKAAELRSKAWGRCPHTPPCESYQVCLHRIASEQREAS
jgi:hypothetical protein